MSSKCAALSAQSSALERIRSFVPESAAHWDDIANLAKKAKREQTMKTKDYTTTFTVDQSPKKSLTPSTTFVVVVRRN